MMGWNSAVEVIACIFRTGINGGGPIAPGRLIPPPYPKRRLTSGLPIRHGFLLLRAHIVTFFRLAFPGKGWRNTRLYSSAAILNILIWSSKSRATDRQCPCKCIGKS